MSSFRNILAAALPRPLKHRLKKLYYPHVLRRFPEAGWSGSAVVKKIVEPGDVVVDAGANIGYVALLLSRWVGPQGRVFSFEPIPETYDLLAGNVKKLGLTNVEIFPYALSSRDGRAEMEVPHYEGGGENFYESRMAEKTNVDLRTFPVEVRRLDSVLDLGRTVSFIKIDVEGHEEDVVRGATRILQASQPALMIEVFGDPDAPGSVSGRLFSLLREAGYMAYWWDGKKLQKRAMNDQHIDYFFLREKHVTRLTSQGLLNA